MRRRCAFTLVELLVVVAIVSILLALLLPAIQRARDAGRLVVCGSNQRQLASAVLNYAAGNLGFMPPTTTHRNSAAYQLTWANTANYQPASTFPNAPDPWREGSGRRLERWLGDSLNDPRVLMCPLGPEMVHPDYPSRYFTNTGMAISYAMLWGFRSVDAQGTFEGPRRLQDQLTGGGLLTADYLMEFLISSGAYALGMYGVHPTDGSDPFVGVYWRRLNETRADWPRDTPFNAVALDGSLGHYDGADLQFVAHENPVVVSTAYPRRFVTRQ